jgi:hypothetical protein
MVPCTAWFSEVPRQRTVFIKVWLRIVIGSARMPGITADVTLGGRQSNA